MQAKVFAVYSLQDQQLIRSSNYCAFNSNEIGFAGAPSSVS